MASIRKYATAKGTRWRVQYRSPDGRSRTKRGFETKAKAQAWADKNAVSIHNQDWINPNVGKTLVSHYAEAWLAHVDTLAPSSQRVYQIAWERHVHPRWANQPIASIRPSAVQKWIDEQPGGAVTVRRNANVLAQILDYPLRDGALRTNPARGLRLPKKNRGVQVYLTADQLMTLANEAGANAPIVLLLGTVGLRWGELAGLQVGDIHFLKRRLTWGTISPPPATSINAGQAGVSLSWLPRSLSLFKPVLAPYVVGLSWRNRATQTQNAPTGERCYPSRSKNALLLFRF